MNCVVRQTLALSTPVMSLLSSVLAILGLLEVEVRRTHLIWELRLRTWALRCSFSVRRLSSTDTEESFLRGGLAGGGGGFFLSDLRVPPFPPPFFPGCLLDGMWTSLTGWRLDEEERRRRFWPDLCFLCEDDLLLG